MRARRARLDGFALHLGRRATLLPSAGSAVHGIALDLPPAEIRELYSEPGLAEYAPEAVLVVLDDGTQMPALCLNLGGAPAAAEKVPHYAAKLRALAGRLGLPAAYVTSIG